MKLQDDTACIATPGFAGFVPSMKYQFGLTYGNATRHILHTDPSLKKGSIQQDYARRVRAAKAGTAISSPQDSQHMHAAGEDTDTHIWKGRNKYATGDDRFSFPPVPGYTGYIPRSQEYFGKPYVETTNASLANFQRMLKSKNQLPPRILNIKADRERMQKIQSSKIGPIKETLGTLKPPAWNMGISNSSSYQNTHTEDMSPYRLPVNHPQKTFISGYTGFVPRLQNHFGKSYSHSVRSAIDEFTYHPEKKSPYAAPNQ